jgi:hypothetical protein
MRFAILVAGAYGGALGAIAGFGGGILGSQLIDDLGRARKAPDVDAPEAASSFRSAPSVAVVRTTEARKVPSFGVGGVF